MNDYGSPLMRLGSWIYGHGHNVIGAPAELLAAAWPYVAERIARLEDAETRNAQQRSSLRWLRRWADTIAREIERQAGGPPGPECTCSDRGDPDWNGAHEDGCTWKRWRDGQRFYGVLPACKDLPCYRDLANLLEHVVAYRFVYDQEPGEWAELCGPEAPETWAETARIRRERLETLLLAVARGDTL